MMSRRFALGAILFLSLGALSQGALGATTTPRVFTFKEQGVVVVEIDPAIYRLKLMTASELKVKTLLSAKDWVKTYRLIGAINAGMYQKDYRTSVGLLIANGVANNSHLKSDKTILAFDPVLPKPFDLPAVQIIDRECQNFDELKPRYRSFLQGIRMVTCRQKNAWEAGGDKWAIAALAEDQQGRVLFLFGREAQTPHDFVDGVMRLPLGIVNMMYLEGGPPAQLYLKAGDQEIDLTGSYSGQATAGAIALRTPIPNILAILPK